MDDGSKVGLPPGTPIHTGDKQLSKVKIRIIDYSPSKLEVREDVNLKDCVPPTEGEGIRWIQVKGVHDVETIQSIGKAFDLHPLVIEDLVRTQQRPKVETIQNGAFLVVRPFSFDKEEKRLKSEQLSIVFGKGIVITFQESYPNMFDAIEKRAKQAMGHLRTGTADYLMYTILDLVVDRYFLVLEQLGDKIETLEDELVREASGDMLHEIYGLKRNIMSMRRHVWPLREVVFQLNRDESHLIHETTQLYLRDLYDHVIRITDLLETYRESLTAMVDIYLSSMSNRMNEVMQVLAVVSTIFIPLTLMASIYGMNFPNMPELTLSYGYPLFLFGMISIGVILGLYFRRIGWI